MLMVNHLVGFGNGAISVPAGSYDYGHALGQGDRTATISISGMTPSGAGTLSNAVDGVDANNTNDAFNFPLGASSQVIVFDFTGPVDFNEFTITWSNALADQGTWVLESSPDNSAWTGRKAAFTLGGTTNQVVTLDTTANVRYWRFRQTSGVTNGSPRWQEITFKMFG